MRKLTVAAAGALAALTLLSACSPSGGSSQSSASGKGSLTIACSQQEDFCQKMTQEFAKASGIKTNYVRLGAGEVLARLQASQGEFDVWSGGQAENHLIADKKGFVERYKSPSASALPEKYNDPDGVWSGFYTDSIGFCSNKDELNNLGVDVPQSWEDLLNPKLKGKIVMAHPATAGVGYMVLFTIQTWKDGNRQAALDYLKELNKNVLQYSKSSATSTEMAGRGEIAVGIALDSDCAKAKDIGFDSLEYSYPSEGTGYEVGAVSVLSGARNKDAAKKYMDWILSKEAQDLYGSVPSFAAPTLPDAKLGKGVPPQDKVNQVKWDLVKASTDRDDFIKEFSAQIVSQSAAK